MSLASWKAAFYPESAKAAAKRGEKAAIEHCIRKWEGLTPENLAAHKLHREGVFIGGPRITHNFWVDAGTCALCQVHPGSCEPCSLYLVRGGVSCVELKEEEYTTPYRAYVGGFNSAGGDPQPMLRDLRSALELVQITVHDGGPASD